MLRNILVASFLIGSACAMYMEYLKFDSDEELPHGNLISDTSDDSVVQDEDLLFSTIIGQCKICKLIMEKVKHHLGNKENAEKIRAKLQRGCDKLGPLKVMCKKLVNKNIDFLVEELSTNDDPKTICIKAGMCKSVDIMELIQVFPQNDQKL